MIPNELVVQKCKIVQCSQYSVRQSQIQLWQHNLLDRCSQLGYDLQLFLRH